MTDVATLFDEMEVDEVVINSDGTVKSISEWTLWNKEPWETVRIVRQPDGSFLSHISDPEHGGGRRSGTLEAVLEPFHPDIAKQYQQLFAAVNPTRQQIRAFGFKRESLKITQLS